MGDGEERVEKLGLSVDGVAGNDELADGLNAAAIEAALIEDGKDERFEIRVAHSGQVGKRSPRVDDGVDDRAVDDGEEHATPRARKATGSDRAVFRHTKVEKQGGEQVFHRSRFPHCQRIQSYKIDIHMSTI